MSPRRTFVPALLAGLVLALSLAPLRAEEDEPSPAERFAAALAALPAPSAAHAFAYEGQMTISDAPMGTARMEAAATTLPNGQAGWRLTDELDFMGGAMVRKASVLLDAHLQPLEGRVTGKEPEQGSFDIRWMRSKTGFRVETTRGEGEDATTSSEDVVHEGPVLNTLTALVLFCRLTHPARGPFAATLFDADPDSPEKRFESSAWSQGEEGTWQGRAVLFLRGTKGEGDRVLFAFDPETREPLGATFENAAGMEMSLAPKAGSATKPESAFSAPASSAEGAALTAALAFSTADLALLEKIVDWPAVYDVLKAQHEAANPGGEDTSPFPATPEALKQELMAQFEQTLDKHPREMIESALQAAEGHLQTTELEGGRVRVTFPPMFQSLELVVGKGADGWRLVRFPER